MTENELATFLREELPKAREAALRHHPSIETRGSRVLLSALDAAVGLLRETTWAAIAYDDAIRSCANNPEKMASFCTAEGDDLDALYAAWMIKARDTLHLVVGEEEK